MYPHIYSLDHTTSPRDTGKAQPIQHHHWWMSVSVCTNMCVCLERTCKREQSTEPTTTTMHGLNLEVEEHRQTNKQMPWVSMVVSPPNFAFILQKRSETRTHMHMNTHQASTQHNTAMTSYLLFFFYLLCLGELKRTHYRGEEERKGQYVCGYISASDPVQYPLNGVSLPVGTQNPQIVALVTTLISTYCVKRGDSSLRRIMRNKNLKLKWMWGEKEINNQNKKNCDNEGYEGVRAKKCWFSS